MVCRVYQLYIFLGFANRSLLLMRIQGIESTSTIQETKNFLSMSTHTLTTATPLSSTKTTDGNFLPNQFEPPDNVPVLQYDFMDLKERCPLADICVTDKGHNLTHSKESCCLPCRCDSVCRKIGNCCDRGAMDDFMCHLPYVKQEGVGIPKLRKYFMVDKCLNSSEIDSCGTKDVAPWGALYPVYDPTADLNYYNTHCAECNGAHSYIYWDFRLESFAGTWSHSHCLSLISGGIHSRCAIWFTPPEEMNLIRHICTNDLISSCNLTGEWTDYDLELDKACKKWFSPMLDMRGIIAYANVYCSLCNGRIPGLCTELVPERDLFGALSMIFDYRQVKNVIAAKSDSTSIVDLKLKTGGCGRYMVKHPTKAEYRTVLCPNGFMRDESEVCVPFSTNWLTSYHTLIVLTPVGHEMLPWSYLTNITDKERASPEIWFDTHITPIGTLAMYGKSVSIHDEWYVGELLCIIGRKISHFDLALETKVIQNAMQNDWTIKLNGAFFQFSAKFHRYASYIEDGRFPRYDLISSLVGLRKTFEDRPPPRRYEHLNIRFRDKYGHYGVILKKTHFCERVRLHRNEWLNGFQEIRLNVNSEYAAGNVLSGDGLEPIDWQWPSNGPPSSNDTVFNNGSVFKPEHEDHGMVLGDSEFDYYVDNTGEIIMEICIETFNPNNRAKEFRICDAASGTVYTGHAAYMYLTLIIELTLKILMGI